MSITLSIKLIRFRSVDMERIGMHPIASLQNPAVKGTSTGQMEDDQGAGDASVHNRVTCKDMKGARADMRRRGGQIGRKKRLID